MIHAHIPPFTASARKLYEETSAIAAAQDAKLDRRPDPVNAPKHYSLAGREAIDLIEAVAATVPDPVAAVLTSHALKYLMRWPRKGGITDLRKCQWYLSRLIAHVDQATPFEGIPVESSYLDSFSPNGSRLATEGEIDNLRNVLTAEELKGFGIGDVPRHPMHAETIRDHDERLSGPEDRL